MHRFHSLQAGYDTIDRKSLWKHLHEAAGVPRAHDVRVLARQHTVGKDLSTMHVYVISAGMYVWLPGRSGVLV